MLARILDEIVDAQTLEYESEMITYSSPRLTSFYDYYMKVFEKESNNGVDEGVCAKLAVSPETMSILIDRDEIIQSKENELTDLLKQALG